MAKELSRDDSSMPRRKFLKLSAATMGAVGGLAGASAEEIAKERSDRPTTSKISRTQNRASRRPYNSEYTGEHLDHVAFPLGGIGQKPSMLSFLSNQFGRAARVF